MEGEIFRAVNDFGEKICIGIQMSLAKLRDIQHGAIRMAGIQIVFVAVADVAAEGVDDGLVVIGV